MLGKYLKDLGIKEDKTPQGWNKDDSRQERWIKEREIYGFDEKETWSMDFTFKLWLYERLSMYNEVNCVDTSFHKYEFKGETITFQECIDRMLDGLKIELTTDEYRRTDEQKEKVEDIVNIFALCLPSLWW